VLVAWWIVWLAGAQIARAESFYLESDPLATREAADEVVRAAATEGCDGQVVRRYVRGEGWRYLFRSDVLADAAVVRGCLERLAGQQATLRLVEREGARTRVTTVANGDDEIRAAREEAPRYTAAEVVERLLRAHAGTTGGPDEAARVLFRYERRTSAGQRVLHTYARRGDDVYLQVEVVEGSGVSSRAGVSDGHAWLEGSDSTLDPRFVREQIDRFSPHAVLRITGELATGALQLPELEQLHVSAVRRVDDGEVVELSFEGDQLTPPLRMLVDARSWRLVALEREVGGATVRWRFLGWREMEDGALRPERVQVWRNDVLVDDVSVQELDLAPTLPEEWFSPGTG
jgi:hypothetical protein